MLDYTFFEKVSICGKLLDRILKDANINPPKGELCFLGRLKFGTY